MAFFAIVIALLLEQVRPLGQGNAAVAALRRWVRGAGRAVDAGGHHHAWLAWALAVLMPALAALGVYLFLHWLGGWPLALAWNVAVLYVTLGFRQFSYHFTGIRDALDAGDEERARQLLARWQQVDASALPRSEIVRHVIEYSVLAAHRHVFGVLACFVLLPGPCGAVLYRLAAELDTVWGQRTLEREDHFSRFARQAFFLIDWVPIRLSALIFSVVGHFEDALFSWRLRGEQSERSLVVTCGAGALGVRLEGGAETNGEPADSGHMQSAVALVWRALLLWLMLLLLLGFAGLFAG